ncbi:MAG: FAD-dependent oxidoreductase, partial [Bacteroidota bacterium]|nr:FAD-dependent oxidoreductase [Bacteroidota bacterium]
MPTGYWETEHLLRPADITVVGAGIVGMSTALQVKRARPEALVRLLERDPLSSGGTTRNAGFACFGSAGEWL